MAAVGRPRLTLTAHSIRPAPAGECEIEVRPVKAGRWLATATAAFSIDGTRVLRLVGGVGEQAPGGPTHVIETPTELPPLTTCAARPAAVDEGLRPELMNRLDVRMPPVPTGSGRAARPDAPR